jgi:hypothetical protein
MKWAGHIIRMDCVAASQKLIFNKNKEQSAVRIQKLEWFHDDGNV